MSGFCQDQSLQKVVRLLQDAGHAAYIGEPVSQLEHALQCAYFAMRAGCKDESILAALLHDVGHWVAPSDAPQMDGLGVVNHEHIGAQYLIALGFSETVAELVRSHVQAKRYLACKNEGYEARLSEASRGTLRFQGGPMNDLEANDFERDPLFKQKVQLRKFDELAKRENFPVPQIEEYVNLMKAHLSQQKKEIEESMKNECLGSLSAEQLEFWEKNGFLLLKGFYRSEKSLQLKNWVEDMEQWPETPGKWMKYFEKSLSGARLLCRVEDFIPYHHDLAEMLNGEVVLGIVSQLMRERAILFKEKINFKLPGGSGFAPHQDAPAFTTFNQKYHVTCMISVDPTFPENGCLEVVPGRYTDILPQEPDGSLDKRTVERLTWEYVTTEPGDVLLFDSYIPHRSGPNRTEKPRRAFYVTYNRASEGDRRTDYYLDKRDKFPPEIERIPGKDYAAGAALYNLANPIDR